MAIDEDDVAVRKRPLWPLLAGGAIIIAIVVGVILTWPDDPDPAAVLVVVHGCPSEQCAHALTDALRGRLAGFELSEPTQSLADPNAALRYAQEHAIANALCVDVFVDARRDAAGDDAAYVAASATATLYSIGGERPIESRAPRIGVHDRRTEAALTRVARRIAASMADDVHRSLLERPAVREFANGAVDDEDVPKQTAIRDRMRRVARAERELAAVRQSCQRARRELTVDRGPVRVRCLATEGCPEEYAMGGSSDGTAAFVRTETPGFTVPLDSTEAQRIETEERLERVPLDGTTRRVLAVSDTYYTYPSISADGSRLVAIEDWSGAFGVVGIDTANGRRSVIEVVENRWVQNPIVSPDGRFVVRLLRGTLRAPAQLVVSEVRSHSTSHELGEAQLGGAWVTVAPGAGASPRLLIAELVDIERLDARAANAPPTPRTSLDAQGLPPHGLPLRLALFDPESARPIAWLADERHRIERVAGTHEGRVVFSWYNGEVCGVGRWDPRENAATTVRTQVCLRGATSTDDGHLVGTARASADGDPHPGEEEIVDVNPEDGTHTVLTANALRERSPRPAGWRVVFDRVGEPRYARFPRVATCWLERPH